MTISHTLGHADSEVKRWRSVSPLADELGLTEGHLADADAMALLLHRAVADAGASVTMPPLITAWTRRS